MHILYVAGHYFGNPDMVALSLELAHRNHRVSVATCFRSVDKHRRGQDVNLFEINPLITIHSLGYKLTFPVARIYRIIKEQGVEIVHALSDYSANVASAAFVSRVANVPFVYTIQGVGTSTDSLVVDTALKLYDRTIERAIIKSARSVILLSRRLISRARESGVEESRVVAVPSGVNHEYFDPERYEVKKKADLLRKELDIDDSIVIGYVGRLIPAKGLTYLISAVKQIQSEHFKACLVIVGDGPQRKNLEMIAKDLGVRTIFAGWQADPLAYYALMDIFALPSFFEGLPNVILEAMSMGKPVVATDVGGASDLVRNGENGFLVPPKDVESLASAIKTLVFDVDLRLKMGRVSRNIVKKNFDFDSIVSKIEKIYEEAL